MVRVKMTKRPDFAAMAKRAGLDRDGIDDLLAEAAYEIEGRAKVKAPVDTGRMRSSIGAFRVQHGRVWKVAAQTNYAVFVERGTRRQAAQPFLKPALLEVRSLLQRLRR